MTKQNRDQRKIERKISPQCWIETKNSMPHGRLLRRRRGLFLKNKNKIMYRKAPHSRTERPRMARGDRPLATPWCGLLQPRVHLGAHAIFSRRAGEMWYVSRWCFGLLGRELRSSVFTYLSLWPARKVGLDHLVEILNGTFWGLMCGCLCFEQGDFFPHDRRQKHAWTSRPRLAVLVAKCAMRIMIQVGFSHHLIQKFQKSHANWTPQLCWRDAFCMLCWIEARLAPVGPLAWRGRRFWTFLGVVFSM